MKLFNLNLKTFSKDNASVEPNPVGVVSDNSNLAELALKTINDGVVIVDKNGTIQSINPAAVVMTNCGGANEAIGLDYTLIMQFEAKDGSQLTNDKNPVYNATKTGQPLDRYEGTLISLKDNKKTPISVSVIPANDFTGHRIITFRNIAKELEEEGAQMEFISVASHEMRTPVASIEGYLSLAVNPQTATIDDRARGYLEAAHAASKHLGDLFRDLLDTTKLDDGRIKPKFIPVEMISTVKKISDSYALIAQKKNIKYQFGSTDLSESSGGKRLEQAVYGYIDFDFLHEIMGNLIENAVKYTPEGGSVYVNALGDGDRVLINVTDTGIGISADDLQHIFQKFYRADNSDTRTAGGTGLGLYLVKQRVEAMDGRVWAESGFGEGSTFFVSLPRISDDEYNKRLIAYQQQVIAEEQARAAQKQQPALQVNQQPSPAQQPVQQPQAEAPTQQPVQQNNIQQNNNNPNGGTQ